MISIESIINDEIENDIFVLPYEIKNLEYERVVNFNRMKHQAILNSNYYYGEDSEEFDIDLSLTSYYDLCASFEIIPDCFLLELIRVMIVDFESMSFASMFSENSRLFDLQLMGKYLMYFNNLNSKTNSNIVRSNINMFVSTIFQDGNKLKDEKVYYDNLLTDDELVILNNLRNQI
ncbi:hypothetical protein [Psychrobacter alimentarius]|uniref:hypothetical protein n=1 Tax=Psychrobacter alimentarius TaxID=261164 RepID=UPI00191900C9|nr:hypothetical protein [Psychrobacter alimentarius]